MSSSSSRLSTTMTQQHKRVSHLATRSSVDSVAEMGRLLMLLTLAITWLLDDMSVMETLIYRWDEAKGRFIFLPLIAIDVFRHIFLDHRHH